MDLISGATVSCFLSTHGTNLVIGDKLREEVLRTRCLQLAQSVVGQLSAFGELRLWDEDISW